MSEFWDKTKENTNAFIGNGGIDDIMGVAGQTTSLFKDMNLATEARSDTRGRLTHKVDTLGNTIGMASAAGKLGKDFGLGAEFAIGGAIAGFAGSLISKNKQPDIFDTAKKEAEFDNMQSIGTTRNELTFTRQQQVAEKGMNVTGNKGIEVERDEIVVRKIGSTYKKVADFKGGKTHRQGGEDYEAKAGDIIFPGTKRAKITKFIAMRRWSAIGSEAAKLPQDIGQAEFGSGVNSIDPIKNLSSKERAKMRKEGRTIFGKSKVEVQKIIYSKLVDAGYTPAASKGIVINLTYESADFTAIQEFKKNVHGTKGLGIAQWTNSKYAKRADNFKEWMKDKNASYTDLIPQINFLIREIRDFPENANVTKEQLNKAKDYKEAAGIFFHKFENPQNQSSKTLQGRITNSKEFIDIISKEQKTSENVQNAKNVDPTEKKDAPLLINGKSLPDKKLKPNPRIIKEFNTIISAYNAKKVWEIVHPGIKIKDRVPDTMRETPATKFKDKGYINNVDPKVIQRKIAEQSRTSMFNATMPLIGVADKYTHASARIYNIGNFISSKGIANGKDIKYQDFEFTDKNLKESVDKFLTWIEHDEDLGNEVATILNLVDVVIGTGISGKNIDSAIAQRIIEIFDGEDKTKVQAIFKRAEAAGVMSPRVKAFVVDALTHPNNFKTADQVATQAVNIAIVVADIPALLKSAPKIYKGVKGFLTINQSIKDAKEVSTVLKSIGKVKKESDAVVAAEKYLKVFKDTKGSAKQIIKAEKIVTKATEKLNTAISEGKTLEKLFAESFGDKGIELVKTVKSESGLGKVSDMKLSTYFDTKHMIAGKNIKKLPQTKEAISVAKKVSGKIRAMFMSEKPITPKTVEDLIKEGEKLEKVGIHMKDGSSWADAIRGTINTLSKLKKGVPGMSKIVTGKTFSEMRDIAREAEVIVGKPAGEIAKMNAIEVGNLMKTNLTKFSDELLENSMKIEDAWGKYSEQVKIVKDLKFTKAEASVLAKAENKLSNLEKPIQDLSAQLETRVGRLHNIEKFESLPSVKSAFRVLEKTQISVTKHWKAIEEIEPELNNLKGTYEKLSKVITENTTLKILKKEALSSNLGSTKNVTKAKLATFMEKAPKLVEELQKNTKAWNIFKDQVKGGINIARALHSSNFSAKELDFIKNNIDNSELPQNIKKQEIQKESFVDKAKKDIQDTTEQPGFIQDGGNGNGNGAKSGDKGNGGEGSKIPSTLDIVGKGLSSLASYAPAIYNLHKGMEPADKVARKYANPQMLEYENTSQPQYNAIDSAFSAAEANARNLSGGVTSNFRSNVEKAWAEKLNRTSQVNAAETKQAQAVAFKNIDSSNRADMFNAQVDNKANLVDMQSKAVTDSFFAQGISDIATISNGHSKDRQQEAFQAAYLAYMKKNQPSDTITTVPKIAKTKKKYSLFEPVGTAIKTPDFSKYGKDKSYPF